MQANKQSKNKQAIKNQQSTMSLENGNGNKGTSTSTSTSPHPEHDEEREYQLCRMEMKRIYAAKAQQQQADEERRQRRIEACDLTGDEFKIVCEELWVDFKSWVTHHENMKNCITKTHNAFRRNLATILFTIVFIICFRWYIGGGKEACAKFSMGGIVLNFVCELFRYLSEALLGMFLGIIGFCVGIMPLVVCICIFEFKDTFPDPIDPIDLINPNLINNQNHLKKD
jgi:hypothetical protein